jgi:GBP family porin
MVDFVAPVSGTGSSGPNFARHPFGNDNLNDDFRMNNALKFQSVDYGGFTFGGAHAFSNAAGGFANNRAYTFGAAYSYGPVRLASDTSTQANRRVGNPANESGVLSSTDGDARLEQRILRAAGRHAFGAATVGLMLTHTMPEDPVEIGQGGAYASLNGENSHSITSS